jgi:hypothetical protein
MQYYDVIKNNVVTKFLNALKIPVSDVIKQVLIKNEEQSAEWDSVYASMVQGNVPAKDVNEMLQDDDVYQYYKQKKVTAEKVRKNQNIGDLFEQELKKVFESDEFKAFGFKIKRDPIGSDYLMGITDPDEIIVEDEDVWSDEYKGEALFVIEGSDKMFLELKATIGNSVSMTRVQANKAVRNKKNYCLVIFNYQSSDDIFAENVKNNSIFLDKIGSDLEIPFSRQTKIQSDIEAEHVDNGIVVDSEYGKVRFRVNKQVWSKGKSLTTIANELLANLATEKAE